MSDNYDFIGGDQNQNDENNDDFDTVGNMWNLGDHSSANDTTDLSQSIKSTMGKLDDSLDGDLKQVLQDASDLVEEKTTVRFECPVESCGLGHSHPDNKHDIRSGFNVEDRFAAQMDFCPYCHCGVNELKMLMGFFSYIDIPVFTDQHDFEAVLEIEPGVLEDIYRRFSEGKSLSRAISEVSAERGVPEEGLAPEDTRDDIKAFFERRRSIENAASSAPIAEQTQNVIDSNREELVEVTS